MKVALMMENSQAAKNPVILNELTSVADSLGHAVFRSPSYLCALRHNGSYSTQLESCRFCDFRLWYGSRGYDVIECSSRRILRLLYRPFRCIFICRLK